ncbi:MAG: efflux RND transporter periplasmic adaptor subunit [Candidatus Cloacimonadaceae bacterium]
MRQIKSSYIITIVIALLLLTGMASCKRKSGPAPDAAGADELPIVMVEELVPRDLNEYISVSGKLEGKNDVTMVSETSGSILKLYKKLGDRVAQFDKIGVVGNTEFGLRLQQAKAAQRAAQAALETAQLNLTASEALFNKNVISQAEYNSAIAALNGASANLEGANANLSAAQKAYDNSYFVAPAAGVISKLMVTEGQYVSYGTPIVYITDNRDLVIKTGVGESQIGKLRQGQSADIYLAGSEKTVKGVISGLGNRPLPGAANYSLEIRLLSSSGLQPGMVANAKILSGVYKSQLYTSINNISEQYDRSYVFTVDADNKIVRKEIQTGKVTGENVIILSGAEAGDRIVTTGTENLEDGVTVQVRS